MPEEKLLQNAIDDWDVGLWNASVSVLKSLVDSDYLPAYPEYLWRIRSDGYLIRDFNSVLERGIALGSADCKYIKLWKEFANRPAVDEYWPSISTLATSSSAQKNALLALGLHNYLHRPDVPITSLKSQTVPSAPNSPNSPTFSAHLSDAITMMCRSYGCMSSLENLSYVWHYGSLSERQIIESSLTPVQISAFASMSPVPFIREDVSLFSLPYSHSQLLNSNLSNEEFNATVFTCLRNLERRLLSKSSATSMVPPSYSDIKDRILSSISYSHPEIKIIEGLSKNAWSFTSSEQYDREFERHSVYLTKRLSDGKWMTLRIGDHTSNTGDYYKYRRLYVPSPRPYANLCIMLHGDREQLANRSYSFRFNAKTADPCITVRDEDFQLYRPFVYTMMHYVHGLIDDKGEALCRAVIEWFSENGNVPFSDPYKNKKNSPSARMLAGWVTVETWDMKYERRRLHKEMKLRQAGAASASSNLSVE